jgi:hypothetical protein
MKIKLSITLFLFLVAYCLSSGQTMYENSRFKFKAPIPEDWRFHQEKTDSLNFTIVAWGLPKVYSEIEKQEVENAVSITALKNRTIKSIDDVINAEFRRTKNMLIMNRFKIDSIEHTCYITNTISGTTSYISQQYFIFKNGIGYIITFTATLGTYEINMFKFEEFYKTVIIE